MEVVFTKTNSYKHSSVALRDDGVRLAVPGYGPSKPIPHDMIHFVAEDELKIDYGFWGCVAAGAVYKGMSVLDGKSRHDSEKISKEIIKKFGQGNTESEVLASNILTIFSEQIESNWEKIQLLQKETWQPSQPGRSQMTHDEIKRICKRIRSLSQDWDDLKDGQTMAMKWATRKSRK
jgi:hypothetical protein